MRLGMRYVKGLRQEIALAIVRERGLRAFASIEDLKQRVPEIQKSELTALAEVGALNFISGAVRRFSPARCAVAGGARGTAPGPLLETAETLRDEVAEVSEAFES